MEKLHKFQKSVHEASFPLSILFVIILVFVSAIVFWQETTPPSKLICNQTVQQSLIPPSPSSSAQKANNSQEGKNEEPVSFLPNVLTPRAGFGISMTADPQLWARTLNAGWYLNWSTETRRSFQYPKFWQMVRLSPGCVYPSKEYIYWLALH